MSYQIKIDAKALRVARMMARIQAKIQLAFAQSGKTQQQLAAQMGVNRSVINRRLKSKSNLTIRSIAELAVLLDKEIDFQLTDPPKRDGRNWQPLTATLPMSSGERGSQSVEPVISSKPKGRLEYVKS